MQFTNLALNSLDSQTLDKMEVEWNGMDFRVLPYKDTGKGQGGKGPGGGMRSGLHAAADDRVGVPGTAERAVTVRRTQGTGADSLSRHRHAQPPKAWDAASQKWFQMPHCRIIGWPVG
jgi:hypothetical protein